MKNSMNLIIKDFNKNDNLINILKYNNQFKFNCSCGNQYCHHLDYIINTISSDVNNIKCEKCFKIIGYDDFEFINFQEKDELNNDHNIIFYYKDNKFHIKCSCKNLNCFHSKNSIFNLISNYIKNKELDYEYKNEYILTQKLESEMNNLII